MHCGQPACEISRSPISITQSLSNEDWPLEVEEINTREDIAKAAIHDQEKKHTLIVLHDLIQVGTFFVVEDDADDSEEDGLEDFEDDVEGLTKLVYPVAFEDSGELGAPGRFELLLHVLKFMLNNIAPLHHLVLPLVEHLHQVVHSLLK